MQHITSFQHSSQVLQVQISHFFFNLAQFSGYFVEFFLISYSTPSHTTSSKEPDRASATASGRPAAAFADLRLADPTINPATRPKTPNTAKDMPLTSIMALSDSTGTSVNR